jgi:hypothetical protein
MNNFFEDLKIIITFCTGADGFEFFFSSSMSQKVLFKFLLASMNSGYFTGSRIRINPPPLPQRDWGQLKCNCEPQFSI